MAKHIFDQVIGPEGVLAGKVRPPGGWGGGPKVRSRTLGENWWETKGFGGDLEEVGGLRSRNLGWVAGETHRGPSPEVLNQL